MTKQEFLNLVESTLPTSGTGVITPNSFITLFETLADLVFVTNSIHYESGNVSLTADQQVSLPFNDEFSSEFTVLATCLDSEGNIIQSDSLVVSIEKESSGIRVRSNQNVVFSYIAILSNLNQT